jgi:hypothetical protein
VLRCLPFSNIEVLQGLTYDNHNGTDHDYNLPHPPSRDFPAGYDRSKVFPGHRVQGRSPLEEGRLLKSLSVAVPSILKHRSVCVAVTNLHGSQNSYSAQEVSMSFHFLMKVVLPPRDSNGKMNQWTTGDGFLFLEAISHSYCCTGEGRTPVYSFSMIPLCSAS